MKKEIMPKLQCKVVDFKTGLVVFTGSAQDCAAYVFDNEVINSKGWSIRQH